MKFSYNLLKKYFPQIPKPEKVAELLGEHTFEVEGFEQSSFSFTNVYTAQVSGVEKHPNADRLRVIRLKMGSQEIYPVVCGAFNFTEGDMVALALPGAHIPQNIHSENYESFTLGKAVIRGVESQGMICAGFELGLVPKPDKGVLVLPKNTKTGMSLEQLLSDIIFDFALTPSRPDLYSHLGIARELAALTGKKFAEPKIKFTYSPKPKSLSVKVETKKYCNEYYGAVIELGEVPGTPPEIAARLQALGSRSVNFIVDLSNIIMFELGRPSHAFDLDATDRKITVRMSKEGEQFTALNHKTYTLDNDTMVIADGTHALDIAGVMGGLDSEISENTKQILLTVVNFNGSKVRKAARSYAIESSAPKFFEKGLYKELAPLCVELFVSYLKQYNVPHNVTETFVVNETKRPKVKVAFTAEGISQLLGVKLGTAEIKRLLKKTGITVSGTTKLIAQVPYWRLDLKDVADIAEEVLRLYGVSNIRPIPLSLQTATVPEDALNVFIRKLKYHAARVGMHEVQNYSFISQKDIEDFAGQYSDFLEIENPQSDELRFMRKNLLYNMLKNVHVNQRELVEFTLFEVGRKFNSFENQPFLFTALAFNKAVSETTNYLTLKGRIERTLQDIGVPFTYVQENPMWLTIKSGPVTIGLLGLVGRRITRNFKIEGGLAFAKLELEKLPGLVSQKTYISFSPYPSISRDLSVVVAASETMRQVEEVIRKAASGLLFGVTATQSEGAGNFFEILKTRGQKNLLIKLEFSSSDRSLTDAEVLSEMDKIMVKLREKGIEIR
ncbi:MAG TPA: phenylalanine--tRNA ligase subunit beta [Patescibacteria group bacterium]|nr:phenylalanine--tRNA ligase subunit beta [Patescibacteria group bacterium]